MITDPSDSREYFMAEAARTARALPVPSAIRFLHGLLLSCEDTEVTRTIRAVYISLSHSDKQLELIQERQLQLAFNPPTETKT